MCGWLSDVETEKWLATLLVRVWTSLDSGSTSYIKRYKKDCRTFKYSVITTCCIKFLAPEVNSTL